MTNETLKLIHGEILKRQQCGSWLLFAGEDRAINIYECDGEWIAKRPWETALATAKSLDKCVAQVLTHYYLEKIQHHTGMAAMFKQAIDRLS